MMLTLMVMMVDAPVHEGMFVGGGGDGGSGQSNCVLLACVWLSIDQNASTREAQSELELAL